jgi:predicted amidohydrolase YtcJ
VVNGLAADRVLRVGAAHSMAGTVEVYRAVAVRGTKIVAVAPDPRGLDGLVGAATRVMDGPGLTLLPAFCDAHEHLLESAKNTALVPVGQARSLAEFAAAVGRAADAAAAGQSVQTSIAWHESNLAEGRLPTRVELDAASPDHPVLARRGGHLAVANSAALGGGGHHRGHRRPSRGRHRPRRRRPAQWCAGGRGRLPGAGAGPTAPF